MTAFSLRPSKPEDLARLRDIEADAATLFPPDVLRGRAARTLPPRVLLAAHQAGLLWVAEWERAGVVGFLAAAQPGDCLHIIEMDVRRGHGRKGIGAVLLRHACSAAQSRGLAWVTLTTFEHLPWNAPFYARHGFGPPDTLGPFPHLTEALRQEQAEGLDRRVALVKRTAGPLA
ncbi:MAG TPA: GNAT family N-acetyltransferase [Gemmatales bacterium]|nr:GNAT family N-acetyltransferase [Gemmatales bacterium]